MQSPLRKPCFLAVTQESVSGHLFVAWPLLCHRPKFSPAGTDEMEDSLSHFLYKKGLENAMESKPVSARWPRETVADVSGRLGMRESGWLAPPPTERLRASEVQAVLRGDFPAEPGSAGLCVLHVALCFCR